MTSLSPANAQRSQLAFQECRDMEGTLREQLEAYAAAGRQFFPAYGEAVRSPGGAAPRKRRRRKRAAAGDPIAALHIPDESGRLISLNSLLEKARLP